MPEPRNGLEPRAATARGRKNELSGGRRRLRGDAFVVEQGLPLALLELFADDVATANEFALGWSAICNRF
jgi:hypothetical protein